MSTLRRREFNPLKILHHMDRLQTVANGKDIAPVTVEIDPVAYCNHACGWCVDPVHMPIRMNADVYRQLIDDLCKFNVGGFRVQGVVLKGGGEPTLHPEFDQFVEQAASAGFAVGVVTNGSQLMRWAKPLATHARYVRVSVDGPTPESHQLIHASRDFDQVMEGIRTLVAARGRRKDPVIGVTFAMDARTISLGAEAITLAESLQVDYALLRPPFFEEVGSERTMSIEQCEAVRQALKKLLTDYDGPLDVLVGDWIGDIEQDTRGRGLNASGRRDFHRDELPIEHRTGRCLASPILAVVTATSDVYGCCNLRALDSWSFGRLDYDSGRGFQEIWESGQRRRVLDRMHCTECIAHCTHPLQRYNEIIEVLRDSERRHSEFV